MDAKNIFIQTGKSVRTAGRIFPDGNFAALLNECWERKLTGFIHLAWAGQVFDEENPKKEQSELSIKERGLGFLIMREGEIVNAWTGHDDQGINLAEDYFELREIIDDVKPSDAQDHLSFIGKVVFNVMENYDINGYAETYFDPRFETVSGDRLKMGTYAHVRNNSMNDWLKILTQKPKWSWK